MITLRPAGARGRTELGWLSSAHTFSFAGYYDPAHLGFRTLRVINQDWVQGGHGFPRHSHQDVEIISYVLEGALEHHDSLGHTAVLRPGEVQVITAGTGVAHSELNPSPDRPVHFLQIWLLPDRRGHEPRYGQQAFPETERRGRLCLLAAGDGRDGALPIHQDADVYGTLLAGGERVTHSLAAGRHAWVHLARGRLRLNDQVLEAGDGAAVSLEATLTLEGLPGDEPAESLLFDLA